VIDLSRGCGRHRPVLIDFVDHGEVRPETAAALAHLDQCTRCTEVVESTMLTITALKRMGDEAATVEPDEDAWPRLQIRIQTWPRRPAVMSPLAGIAMSFAIVTVLVVPSRFGGDILGPVASPNAGTALRSESVVERRIEADYIAAGRQGSLNPPAGDSRADVASASYPRRYPDNLRPTRKEVGPTEPSGRPSGAI
jgi:anti-sigma factor RsiW